MKTTMTGALIAALLASGLLVGVSQGGTTRIAAPLTVELVSGASLKEVTKGIQHQLREEALDDSGTRVGTIRWDCANGADWHCTVVYSLRGSVDERGTVVAAGIFRGFTGESLAVTGGTGAYANVRGSIELSVGSDGFTHTLELIP